MGHQIFISYRRETGDYLAKLLKDSLTNDGYTVFLDVDSMQQGSISEQIKKEIEECECFIPLMTKEVSVSKWVQQEHKHAIENNKKIVPVLDRDFEFTSKDNKKIKDQTGVKLLTETFDEGIRKIKSLVGTDPVNPPITVEEIKVLTKTFVPNNLKFFLGREEILDEIRKTSQSINKPVVLLNGIGGIGKTMTSRKIYFDYKNKIICDDTRYLAWVNYDKDIISSLKSAFKVLSDTEDDKILDKAQEIINLYGKKLVLFLDNANELTEDEENWISNLSCRVIITSRQRYDSFESKDISELSEEDSMTLYKNHAEINNNNEDDILKQILKMILYHPLTIELVAKTQKNMHKSVTAILEILESNGITMPNENIVLDSRKKETIDIILTKVFDISKLGEEETRELTLFSLLSPNTPIEIESIENWFIDEDKQKNKIINTINFLTERGWLTEDEEGKVYIHPVIAEVVRNKEKPDFSYAEGMINKIVEELAETNVVKEKSELLIHCTAIEKGIKKEKSEETAWFQHEIGYDYHHIASYSKALEYYNNALLIFEKVLGEEHPNTATTYNNIALVYADQGKYDKALEYYNKAKEIIEKKLGEEHRDTAKAYNNIAGVYRDQGNYDKSLEYYNKAKEIKGKELGKEHRDTATTYNNIAGMYEDQGNYDKALEYYNKALAIREKVLGEEDPYTAKTYNNIAGVYYRQGDYDKSLDYYNKAKKIIEKVLGKEHPDTATTYNNIASVYKGQGKYDKALEYFERALIIFEEFLGSNHPNTKILYGNIASLYMEMDNQENV